MYSIGVSVSTTGIGVPWGKQQICEINEAWKPPLGSVSYLPWASMLAVLASSNFNHWGCNSDSDCMKTSPLALVLV